MLSVRNFVAVTVLAAFSFSTASCAQNLTSRTGTDAASLGLNELKDDLSRQELFSEIRANDELHADTAQRAKDAIETFNLEGPFRFPGDARYDPVLNQARTNSIFGVDISHHTNEAFPIERLRSRNVHYLYMKATQGAGFLDPKFAAFWKRAGNLPKGNQVHRGAYHFLSACEDASCKIDPTEWGKKQATTFVRVVIANGGLLQTDMPPVVDLEWDKANREAPDRWQKRTPQQIVAMMDAFLSEVAVKLKRTPMIYTTKTWWSERMGSTEMSPTMKKSPLWLADYSKSSRATETPRLIGNTGWLLWQFTDSGMMATGYNGKFDTNIYKGEPAGFYSSLGISGFEE